MSIIKRSNSNTNNIFSSNLTHAEYYQITEIVYNLSRIDLGPNRYEMVKARLQKQLHLLNLKTYQEYINYLKSPNGASEITALIDLISTNYTFFFREESHFNFLKNTILPQWCAPPHCASPFRVWSAASSSGEEPYSIAITIQEYLKHHNNFDWLIDCSDISTRMLKHASEGIYEAARLERVNKELTKQYFQEGYGEWKGHYRVMSDIRKRLQFHQLNLLQTSYPFSYKFHVIFCRNVMIYFNKETQSELIKKLLLNLHPGGHLIVGHAESLAGVDHSLRLIEPAVYQLPAK